MTGVQTCALPISAGVELLRGLCALRHKAGAGGDPLLEVLVLHQLLMLKGTRVDGVYTADPEKDPTATKFSEITYDEIYHKGLKVMDLTATTMCKENHLPIYVFNMDVYGNLKKVMEGENIGTLVHN